MEPNTNERIEQICSVLDQLTEDTSVPRNIRRGAGHFSSCWGILQRHESFIRLIFLQMQRLRLFSLDHCMKRHPSFELFDRQRCRPPCLEVMPNGSKPSLLLARQIHFFVHYQSRNRLGLMPPGNAKFLMEVNVVAAVFHDLLY